MTKKEMRALIAQRVKNLSPVYCREADEAICRLVRQADCYRTAQTVFCYAGSEREIDTMGLLHALLSDGKRALWRPGALRAWGTWSAGNTAFWPPG